MTRAEHKNREPSFIALLSNSLSQKTTSHFATSRAPKLVRRNWLNYKSALKHIESIWSRTFWVCEFSAVGWSGRELRPVTAGTLLVPPVSNGHVDPFNLLLLSMIPRIVHHLNIAIEGLWRKQLNLERTSQIWLKLFSFFLLQHSNCTLSREWMEKEMGKQIKLNNNNKKKTDYVKCMWADHPFEWA